MTDKNVIPYLAYDEALAKFERVNKRSWIVTIILIVLLFLTNGAWLYYESQWETVSTTSITQESNAEGGGTAVVNNGGDVNYGTGKTNDNNN